MTPDVEAALLSAKFDEAAAFSDGWCCDGLDDADEFVSSSRQASRSTDAISRSTPIRS
ncbi:MAG: hypothetical protein IPH07_15655 [Deltaproteobacteria bacterium]|nr:hypothetical protein [Deltaproteobacteria bacterium]